MKFEISKKDKKLLVFLSMFVIIVCIGYWGLYPAYVSIKETENSIEDEQNTKNQNDLKLSQLDMYEADNVKLEEDILSVKNTYYPMMTSVEIDKYFTELVLNDYGLISYSLSIGSQSATDLEPYIYSEKAAEEAAAEEAAAAQSVVVSTADDTSGTSDSTTLSAIDLEEAAASVGIYSVTVTMKLGGTEEQLMRFIDDMSTSDKKMRVKAYSWSSERNLEYDENGNYSVDINRTLNITIEMYMCEE